MGLATHCSLRFLCGVPLAQSSRSTTLRSRRHEHSNGLTDHAGFLGLVAANRDLEPGALSDSPRNRLEAKDRTRPSHGNQSPLSVLADSVLGMDISSIASAEQAKAVADAMMSGMRQLRDAPYYKFSRDDLLETGRMLESLSRSLYAAQVRWVGEVEDSGVAAELSCSSTRVLLRDVLRISSGDAADRVRAAKLTAAAGTDQRRRDPPTTTHRRRRPGRRRHRSGPRRGHHQSIHRMAPHRRPAHRRPGRTTTRRPSPRDRPRSAQQGRATTRRHHGPRRTRTRMSGTPHPEPNSGSVPGTPTPGSPRSPAPSPTKAWRSSGKPPSPSPNRSPTTTAFGIRGHRRTGSPKHTSTCSAPTSTKVLDPASVGTSRTSR